MQPDPVWQGQIAFHELLFGTWLSYIALVATWERFLGRSLEEWQYAFLTCLGASFFAINHYLNHAPFYLTLINSYTGVFLLTWYLIGIRGARRSPGWAIKAIVAALVYSALYVGFEMVGRWVVSRGVHEMWVLVAGFVGLGGVIVWRGRPRVQSSHRSAET